MRCYPGRADRSPGRRHGTRRTHDPQYLVAVQLPIVGGDAGPKAGDLQDHFRAVEAHELRVTGGLIVLPDVVGHGSVYVPLQPAVVREPAAGARVQVNPLCLLPAVAAALPREHGPSVSRLVGGGARSAQSALAVEKQGSRYLGEAQIEQGEDEELVPEYMATVRLSVPTSVSYTHLTLPTNREV